MDFRTTLKKESLSAEIGGLQIIPLRGEDERVDSVQKKGAFPKTSGGWKGKEDHGASRAYPGKRKSNWIPA